MAFSISNGTVTVTGTESIASAFSASFNNPSGNSGTHIDRVSGADSFVYIVKDIRFSVPGTLNFYNSTIFSSTNNSFYPAILIAAGIVNIGAEQTLNNYLYSSLEPVCIEFAKNSVSNETFRASESLVIFDANGSTLNIYGAKIIFDEGCFFNARNGDFSTTSQSGTLVAKDTVIHTYTNTTGSNTGRVFSLATRDTTLGVTLKDVQVFGVNNLGIGVDIREQSGTLTSSITGYVSSHIDIPFQYKSDFSASPFTRFNLQGGNSGITCSIGEAKIAIFRDLVEGNAAAFAYADAASFGTGIYDITTTFVSAQDFRVRTQDTNNGSRTTAYATDEINTFFLSSGTSTQFLITTIFHKTASGGTAGNGFGAIADDRGPINWIARLFGFLQQTGSIASSAIGPLQTPIAAAVDNDASGDKATIDAVAGWSFTANSLTLTADLTNQQIYNANLSTKI